MSRRLFFTGGVPADVDNRFTPGSGVGGRSRAVRRALVRRAANSTCCQPGGGASGGHGAPGGGVQPVIFKDVDVGFWIESSGKPLDKIQAIFGALNGNDGTYPGPNIKILVLRMNSYSRPTFEPTPAQVAPLVNNSNEDFYGDVNTNGSFANWANANSGLLSGVEEIWVVPYQDIDSGFDKSIITPNKKVVGGYDNMSEQYMNDLWVAAEFINNTWKSLLPSEIANKVKGVVFELENTSLEKYHQACLAHPHNTLISFNLYPLLSTAIFGNASLKAGSLPPSTQNLSLTSGRTWSGAGITPNNGAAITGDPSVGNPEASDEYSPIAFSGWGTVVYYWRGYSKYFPQIYNVGNLIVPGNQDMTNVKFWKYARKGWQKDSSYSRMFSLEAPNIKEDKWGKGAFLSNPSLAGVIQYIRQQGGLGTSVLFMPADFDYSAPLIG